jgi:hypothetical protein
MCLGIVEKVTLKLRSQLLIGSKLIIDMTVPVDSDTISLDLIVNLKKDFGVEDYCNLILPHSHEAAFSNFGVVLLRLAYENFLDHDGKCQFCDSVEDEYHVLINCNVNGDLRESLTHKAGCDKTF